MNPTRKSNYDKFPTIEVKGFDEEAFRGYRDIVSEVTKASPQIVCIECYPGVRVEEIGEAFRCYWNPTLIIDSRDIFFDTDVLNEKMASHLTSDRVRGVMYYGSVTDFIDLARLEQCRRKVSEGGGRILIIGFGASLISRGDVLVYADLTRWQAQLRYRAGECNFKQHNADEDPLIKNKRGYFIEWRIADKLKVSLLEDIDYYLDTEEEYEPALISGRGLLAALRLTAKRPFRLVPYFDPGVWGGQWMKEVCDLDRSRKNYAWSFDGVPEENALRFSFGGIIINSPAMNLVKYQPRELLGGKTFSRFGAEYPIRFDFLDTIGGQNLSLQVHPTTEYIRSKFGMPYTQDESYYILDAEEGGGVYLGVKEGIDPEEMIRDLKEAQQGLHRFHDEKYINRFPAKKHDHFLIPAGTIHCSSAGTMVLEISATPYIFTFKLWDWDRLGLDGLPRPIHIEDGEKVIDWSRDTKWVKENLVCHFETIHDGEDYQEVKTGLHELEFIETRVITSRKETTHCTGGEVNQLNLVEGEEVDVISPDGRFEPFRVHYAETFIIPASIDRYVIRPVQPGAEYKVVKACVRFG